MLQRSPHPQHMNKFLSNLARFLKDPLVYGPLAFGVFFSLLSNALGWDIAFQELFWDSEQAYWRGDDSALYTWMYHYGVVPALLVAIGGLLCLILSFNIRKLVVTRRVSVYLFLVLAIGNGLITNAMLKEFWGRPRPAQCQQFGGTEQFEPSLKTDFIRNGKSFPCGHATMGYYFFALALLFRGNTRRLLWLGALAFGVIIAVARSSMGHFLTDGVWAGIIMWLSSYILFHLLRLENGWTYVEPPAKNERQAKLRKLTGYALIPLLLVVLVAVAVATPRDKTRYTDISFDDSPAQELILEISGALKIETNADSGRGIAHGVGFGLPKTALMIRTETGQNTGQQRIVHFVRGFFSELNATTTLQLPSGHSYTLILPEQGISQVSIDGELVKVSSPLIIDLTTVSESQP